MPQRRWPSSRRRSEESPSRRRLLQGIVLPDQYRSSAINQFKSKLPPSGVAKADQLDRRRVRSRRSHRYRKSKSNRRVVERRKFDASHHAAASPLRCHVSRTTNRSRPSLWGDTISTSRGRSLGLPLVMASSLVFPQPRVTMPSNMGPNASMPITERLHPCPSIRWYECQGDRCITTRHTPFWTLRVAEALQRRNMQHGMGSQPHPLRTRQWASTSYVCSIPEHIGKTQQQSIQASAIKP